MHHSSFSKLYAITLGLLALIDIPWILVVARRFYTSQIGHLMTEHPQWWPAIIFYTSYAAALIVFALKPGIERDSIFHAARLAFFLGFITYGAYDLTNQATLQDWPLVMTVVDIAWGASMSTIVTTLAFLAIK